MDADPLRASSAAATGDVISRLVGIYGSKELFINEYRWGWWGGGCGWGVASTAHQRGSLGCHMAEQQKPSRLTSSSRCQCGSLICWEQRILSAPTPQTPPAPCLSLSPPRSMLADRLLSKGDYDCDRELRTLELLKVGARQGTGLAPAAACN